MKKIFALAAVLMVSMVLVFADSHLGRTEETVSDSSFVVLGYYKGEKETTSVTLAFKDISNQTIIHSDQSSTGTKVNVSDSHLGENTGTIFSWTMEGNFTKTSSLKFTFSVLQAEVNGVYYQPTYTLKMTINQTKRKSNGNNVTDSFYSDANPKTQVVGGGDDNWNKSNSEFRILRGIRHHI